MSTRAKCTAMSYYCQKSSGRGSAKYLTILRRWKRSNRTEKYFLEKNADWLNKDSVLLLEVFENSLENLLISSLGQQQTSFEQSSERSKRREESTIV